MSSFTSRKGFTVRFDDTWYSRIEVQNSTNSYVLAAVQIYVSGNEAIFVHVYLVQRSAGFGVIIGWGYIKFVYFYFSEFLYDLWH